MTGPPELRWADLDDVPADDRWLGATERAVLAGLHVAKRRADWRLGRWTAKHAVLAAEAVAGGGAGDRVAPDDAVGPDDLAAVELLAAADGAPEAWRGDTRLAVSVSWSHRAGRAVAAATGAGVALGVDLEVLERRSEAFLGEWFSARERAWIGDDAVVRANLLWTAKEAAAKLRREGLRLDVRALAVSVPGPPGAAAGGGERSTSWAPVSVAEPGPVGRGPIRGWWSVTGGFVVTVLTEPPTGPPHG